MLYDSETWLTKRKQGRERSDKCAGGFKLNYKLPVWNWVEDVIITAAVM